jgi:transketolase
VTLIGNGGGYGYGVMGATHHALEDYGALLCLPHLHAFVPAFSADVAALVPLLARFPHPAYLRLGRDEAPEGFRVPDYAPWRRILQGAGPTLVAVGPLIGDLIAAMRRLPEADRPDLWALSELPIDLAAAPPALLQSLRQSDHLVVVEEHVAQGGVGPMLAHALLSFGIAPRRFTHHCARGYPSGRYGSQRFHRKECGLDADSVLAGLSPMTQRTA